MARAPEVQARFLEIFADAAGRRRAPPAERMQPAPALEAAARAERS